MQDRIECRTANIRSPSFLLARAIVTCGNCRAPTPVLAFAVPPGHETLESIDEVRDEEGVAESWCVAEHHAFLFFVEFLPSAVQERLNRLTRSYCLGAGDSTGYYWANLCERCGSFTDDNELFCEPGGAFFPTDESSAGQIHLLSVDDAFEAYAAGYAPDPAYFDAMRNERAESWLSIF
jgi:hypothetical protein